MCHCKIHVNLSGVNIMHAELWRRRLSKDVKSAKDSVHRQCAACQGTGNRQENVRVQPNDNKCGQHSKGRIMPVKRCRQ
jgi:hypothetical protein